jgi:hypothetical protein
VVGESESYDPVVLVDPASLPEFASVIRALRRGSRWPRLRSLEIVCPNDHRLGEVFGTGEQAVLLAHGRVQYTDGIRDGLGTVRLHDLQPPVLNKPIAVRMQCRCKTLPIEVSWITTMLRLGVRRAVYTWDRARLRSPHQ